MLGFLYFCFSRILEYSEIINFQVIFQKSPTSRNHQENQSLLKESFIRNLFFKLKSLQALFVTEIPLQEETVSTIIWKQEKEVLKCLTQYGRTASQSIQSYNDSEQLRQFPNASATVAIFGTQSTGKSTLMNNAFGTAFPILNTKKDRMRCTKGVWYQNVGNFNIIDTEGFDSEQRSSQQRILQKQIALFCLALSDVVIINLWMNQIGRYEGSHTHILKSIIKVSQRLISSQQKKLLFVIKDCTQDADRNVIRQQLQLRINEVISQCEEESGGKHPKLSIDYYFMSHFHYKKQMYLKQARQLKQAIKVRRSHLSYYTPEERAIYIRDLWDKITSPVNQVDLKSIQDALQIYSLERIKDQTLDYAFKIIQQIKDLDKFKSYERYTEYVKKQAQRRFVQYKPMHVAQKQLTNYINDILDLLHYQMLKHFATIILPNQQAKLLTNLDKTLAANNNSRQLQKLTIKKKKQTTELYKKLIISHKDSLSLLRKFTERINQVVIKYERQIAHLFNMFQSSLEKELNDELDRQLARRNIYFDSKQIDSKIKKVCKQFDYNEWEINFKDMWEKISFRTINLKLPQRIEELSNAYTQSNSIWTGDRTNNILAFHTKLQKDAQQFCGNLINYFQEETLTYQQFDTIKDRIMLLTQKAIYQQRARFHITLLIIAFFMFFFYGEFVYLLSMLPIKKKKRKYWINLYIFSLTLISIIVAYTKRKSIRRFLGMN